tara:strand:- start:400 stop:522 length:123 start_codon:yes stop_codon:yes gene_type:complete
VAMEGEAMVMQQVGALREQQTQVVAQAGAKITQVIQAALA